jgi:hypothetical protein
MKIDALLSTVAAELEKVSHPPAPGEGEQHLTKPLLIALPVSVPPVPVSKPTLTKESRNAINLP